MGPGGAWTVHYRDGDLDDVDAVATVAVEVRGGDLGTWRRRIERALSRPDCHLVLAWCGDRPVGYGKAARHQPTGPHDPAPAGYYLTGLDVLPSWRRRGVGTGLTSRRLARAWRHEPAVWTFTNARNTASIALHTQLGFIEVDRATSYLGATFDGGSGVLLRAEPPTR